MQISAQKIGRWDLCAEAVIGAVNVADNVQVVCLKITFNMADRNELSYVTV